MSDASSAGAVPTVAIAALASSALVACGGGGGGSSSGGGSAAGVGAGAGNLSGPAGRNVALLGNYAYPAAQSDAEAARFLLQAQFSASDADIAALRATTYAGWLQTQIATSGGQFGWDWLNSRGQNVPAKGTYFSTSPGDAMVWNQLMASPDGARKRMALALSEIFVVSMNTMNDYWPAYVAAHYWDLLVTYAWGNYRDLLEAVTLSLAMGNFLNTRGNKKADGRGSEPDENYAREVMQLFSIGLVMLNMDGTPQLGAAGAPVATYSNTDVTNLAQVFTGYDMDSSQNQPTTPVTQPSGAVFNVPQTTFARLPMVQVSNGLYHSSNAVTFLGVTIDAGTSAAAALKIALDTLFNHPNNAPFISKQLIQRLVTSNPSPAYVQRVANVYADNGQGVRGDLAYVYAAIVQDDEARAPSGLSATQFGKLREPMVRLTQWARTFGVTSTSGNWQVGDTSNPGSALGQSPLRASTVFNFFRPGYVPPATALSAGAVAPEFQLVNESSVAGYINYLQYVIDSGIASSDMRAAYTVEIGLTETPSATNPGALVDRLNLLLCAGQLSAATLAAITAAVGAMPATVASAATTATNLRRRVCAAVLLVMACAEYLVQK